MYIYQRRFYTHPASLVYFIPALSPYLPFRFFGIFYGCCLATSTIPHPYILTSIVSHVSLPLPGPYHPPAPTCPSYPPFRFFDTFYGCSHTTSTIPHPYILIELLSHVPLPLPGPSHPLPTYLPPPTPFSLFWAIYGRFFLYIHMLFYIYVYIHDF